LPFLGFLFSWEESNMTMFLSTQFILLWIQLPFFSFVIFHRLAILGHPQCCTLVQVRKKECRVIFAEMMVSRHRRGLPFVGAFSYIILYIYINIPREHIFY
jgi:ABC-type enterochelin transport system permease subunit